MDLVKLSVRQPVTVTVGVILILLAGALSFSRLPIQLTPNVDQTIIAVTTTWLGASPQEIEQEVIDPQEEKLQSVSGLIGMTSTCQQGQGRIRLEFEVGVDKEAAMREVGDKLREVPSYPVDVDEPVVEATDPETHDYIAWIAFRCSDPKVDVRTLGDFVTERIEPILERVPGIAAVNVLGGRERVVQVRFDPVALAARGLTPSDLADALRARNRNVSAGEVELGKLDIRLRTTSQYESLEAIERTVVRSVDGVPILVRDVAEVVQTFREPRTFVRSLGEPVVIMNAEREVGSNLMQVMDGLKAAIARLNAEGGMLDAAARQLGIDGKLRLDQVFDQTVYIQDALDLVSENIWIGGGLAMFVLVLFLRSLRSVGIISLAIPVSLVGAVVAMVALGRSVNVISLAGMAFAVGMVVDNSIVVLENIFRHLEMGKRPMQAAYDGAREVWGAVLASTLTTIVVFVPILLIEEEAGQLFRDIALAICATVGISMAVALTVIPSAAARVMRTIHKPSDAERAARRAARPRWQRALSALAWPVRAVDRLFRGFPDRVGRLVYRASGSVVLSVLVVLAFTTVSLGGSRALMPPVDYLPQGNRNLAFGMVITPPGYSLAQQSLLADRIEAEVRPFFEAGLLPPDSEEYRAAVAKLPAVPTFDPLTFQPGPPVVPPPLSNYFLVSFEGTVFQGGISIDPKRVVDLPPLLQHATRSELTPGSLAFAFQAPLFQLGGRTGSAIKIDLSGTDLDVVTAAAQQVYLALMQRYGPMAIQPEPSNFNLPSPEMRVEPDDVRLAEAGMTAVDLALAVEAAGDGAILGDYRLGGETIDLVLMTREAGDGTDLSRLGELPLATPIGRVVPLESVARIERVNGPPQINRVNRQRAVTLQLTPPKGMPLEHAITEVDTLLGEMRATGQIPPQVESRFAGSASKLQAVRNALLGDGSLTGTLGSSLVLALLVVYLVMCVLFQSFVYPFVIMFSVPLATFGGFLALAGVHAWSLTDRYMPVQMLDVLTMLGFVILIGVVVNNAILIVHQALNFLHAEPEPGAEPMTPRQAIAESVRTRVRPIMMSTLTSVGGMLPLVLMPGSGSELYRGLGSVVVGGLLVSTFFSLVLVPLLLSLFLRGRREAVAI